MLLLQQSVASQTWEMICVQQLPLVVHESGMTVTLLPQHTS